MSTGGTPTTFDPLIGSASLVLNVVRGSRLTLYVVGGYTLLDFGTRALYQFTLTLDSYAVLDAVAASLLANPEIRIEIAG